MKLKVVVPFLLLAVACRKGKSENPTPEPDEPSAQEQPAPSPEAEPALIGGRPADPKEWPASVYASMSGARCSATVVGPQVLTIASHCVAHGGAAAFSAGPNRYTSVCSRSPLYRKGTDHDLALCKISQPVEGIPFEVINTDEDLIKVGSEILLTGYGCVRPGGGGGNDGIYRIGEAKIIRESNPYDFTARGKAALCFGDSGGPAFIYLDEAKTKRVQVSTNSKGDIRTTSYLTSLSTRASKSFIESWAKENKVKICGIDKDLEGCRHGEAVPPPPPPDPDEGNMTCSKIYEKLAACIKTDVVRFKLGMNPQ